MVIVTSLFAKNAEGNRPLHADYNWFYKQPGNEQLVLFFEYFHGDTGASHQTGWTALVAELINELKEEKIKDAPKVVEVDEEEKI
jgi:hypothetical protein